MIKSSLKTLYIAFLILFMGSVIFASDDVEAPSIKTAASVGITPDRIISILSRGIESDELAFSNRLLEVGSREDVDALLIDFKKFGPQKQQSVLTAVVVMAVGVLERADKVDQAVLWTTVRLANFLLGNCSLPATHGWLEIDSQRLIYLRDPAVAQSIMDRIDNPPLAAFAKGFMQGAKAFGQTYCNLYDFIFIQEAFDVRGIFRDAKCMPSAVVIFSRAIAQNWQSVEMDYRCAVDEAREIDSQSMSGSTVGTIAQGDVLRILNTQSFAEEVGVFVGRLFPGYGAGEIFPLDELLRQYTVLDEPLRSDVVKAAIVQAFTFLDGADARRNPQAWWIAARLAAFLLSNRLLPPLHGWLDGVSVDDADDDAPSNMSALRYLMAPETGMLHSVMKSLVAKESPSEVAGSSTNIWDFTLFFKSVAARFDEAYRVSDHISKTQFFRDKTQFRSRIRPNILEILDTAVHMTLVAEERASARSEAIDSVSPGRAAALGDLDEAVVHEEPTPAGVLTLLPGQRQGAVLDAALVSTDSSVNRRPAVVIASGRVAGTGSEQDSALLVNDETQLVNDETQQPPKPSCWKRFFCWCC